MSIVCATDFSEAAEPALVAAAAIADRTKEDDVWLVHAMDLLAPHLAKLTFDEARLDAERQLTGAAARLQKLTTRPVRSAVLYGAADEALVEFARRRLARLLVMGSRGHGASPLHKLGGTSERVALHAESPLLVVRDGAPFEAWVREERPLRILLGVDHTTSWEHCASWVNSLRESGPCDVKVGNIYYANEERARYGLPSFHSIDEPDREVELLLTRDMEARMRPFVGQGTVAFRAMRGIGRLGDHLVQLAQREQVDIVAIGTHQRRGLSRLASVASVTLHYGDTSVLLVPVSPTMLQLPSVRSPRTILVATDLSSVSSGAVSQAYALLEDRGRSHIVLFHWESPDRAAAEGDISSEDALEALIRPGWQGSTTIEVVRTGTDPVKEICEAAERHGADLVCLGSHGRTGLPRAVLGSVAEAVLRSIRKPVLIVKPLPE